MILIVDDELQVRSMLVDILVDTGYAVVDAEDGYQAAELLQRYRDHVNLVLLDVLMPEMPCIETYNRLQQVVPGIPVLLMSGFPKDHAQQVLDAGAVGFLRKPFKVKTLFSIVDQYVTPMAEKSR